MSGGNLMIITLNYKDNRKEVLNEEEAKKAIESINYLKLIKYFMASKKIEKVNIKALNKEIRIDELKSIEVLL